jgi:alpha-tubulin suppressor-like RCC1 family protein
MKLFYAAAVGFIAVSLSANPLEHLPEFGPHHRVVTTASGGYVALANGMHYLDGAEWKDSDPTIDLQPGGAAALRLPYSALFGQSLAAGVDILTPDGLHLRGAPRAIAYFDAFDGRTVILGVLKDPPTSAARLHPPNLLVYPDAFDGLRASVRYILDKGSIIQCVVFGENLPDPALFGMNPGTVRIEVWNAFTEAPVPQQSETVVWVEPDPVARAVMAEPDLVDNTLDFGAMRMIPGKAFLLSAANGNPSPGGDIPGSVPVFKQWLQTEQESWLIEAVEYSAVQDKLSQLAPSSLVIDPATASQFVSDGRDLPFIESAEPVNLPIQVISGPPTEGGFGIDYTLVYSTSSWTFQSGVTYLVDGSFSISTSTTIQTNAIIKYRRNAVLTLSGTLTTPATGPAAILTSFDDYTVGELIPGGTPVGYIGTTALSLYNVSGYYIYVENLEFRHFKTAISYYSPSGNHIIRSSRFDVCQTGLNAYFTTVTLSNSIACAVPTLYTNSGSSSITTSTISTDCQRFVDTGGNNSFGQRNVPATMTNDVIAIAAGGTHSLALKANGTVVAWGANDYGQTTVPPGLTNVIGIAAGWQHSLALRANGTVVAWGENEHGETNVPSGLTNVIDIKAGIWHSLALKSDGSAVAWGWNGFGSQPVPTDVTNIVAISACGFSSMALRSNGTGRVWGGPSSAHHAIFTNAVGISVGNCYALNLRTDGTVSAWGCNFFGQTNVPVSATNVIAVASAFNTGAVLRRDGTVSVWGLGQYGQTNLPAGLSNVVALSGTGDHFIFIRDGMATPTITTSPESTRRFVGGVVTFTVVAYSLTTVTYQWQFNGTNIAGATNASLTLTNLQISDAGSYTVIISNGAGTITSVAAVLTVVPEPVILSQPSDLRVLAGSNITFSLTLSNAVGATNFWQLNGITVFISPATNYDFIASALFHGTWTVLSSNQAGATLSDPWTLQVVLAGQIVGWGDTAYDQTNAPYPLTNLVAVAAGEHHSLGLKDDGTVIGWGRVMHDETNAPSGLNDVIAVGAGAAHSMALKGDGTVVAWGDNGFGQTNVPAGLAGVKAIAAGYHHNLALKTNGVVVAWGYNGSGQTDVPSGLTNVVAIAAGWSHSIALRADSTVCAWGINDYGQCDAPIGLTNVVAISSGIWHSLALKSDGTVVGWGANTYGEINPPNGLSNVFAIAAGGQYSLALKNDGTVIAWGKGIFGVTNVPTPLWDVYSIAAGFNHALALTYSPVVNYVIDPSRDLLLVCNTNCADSVAVMNYYRTNRPMVSAANVLGIGGASTNAERYADLFETTNTLIVPVLNWLTNAPTKRPNYIILFYGVPATTCNTNNNCMINPSGGAASSSYILWNRYVGYPGRRLFTTHINMRTPQDCFAYVDKLADFGTNYSPGRVYISPGAGGHGGTNYFFDDVRVPGAWDPPLPGVAGSNGVVNFGGSISQISYSECTNLLDPMDLTCWNTHFFHCTNVAGYMSWGYHGGLNTGFPTNGNHRFYGNSAWYVVQTIESFNGQWVPFYSQTSFHDYFTGSAFWGTNYSHTPVGAISHTDEPYTYGVADSFIYFGFWHAKKNFAICAWSARKTHSFQAIGDPFVTK